MSPELNRRTSIAKRVICIAAAGLVSVGTLSACGKESTSSAGAPKSSPMSVSASPSAATPTAQSDGGIHPTVSGGAPETAANTTTDQSSGDDSSNGQSCGVNPNAAEITNNIDKVPAPNLKDLTWVETGDSNYDPCKALSYATIRQSEIGDSQFQTQLMLFHKGKYIGAGSDTIQHHEVVGATSDSVTVKYRDYEALDATGQPLAMAGNYTTNVTYRWNGQKVVAEGRIPNLNEYK